MNEKHFALLGKPAKDKVTGFSGIITSISFDLYGCIQAVITPPTDKEGMPKDGHWFDVTRVDITKNKAVMQPPDYEAGYIAEGRKGAALKPLP